MMLRRFVERYGRSASLASTSIAVVAIAINPDLPYVVKESILSAGTVSEMYPLPIPSSATEPCRRGSSNCIRTTWTARTDPIQPEEAIQLFRDCLSKYPQEGQDGIDKGGWEVMEDKLSQGGSARVEFRSGIGKNAQRFNRGRPFVDDLLVKAEPEGIVQIRSSSRKGMYDDGVNKRRVLQLASCMAPKYETPDPDYKN
jgi:hypothetical protein